MKSITPATVTVGMFAIAIGLVAAYTARHLFEPPAPVDNSVTVVVPRINLPKFARIRQQDLKVIRIEPSELPAGAAQSPERIVFRTTRETILADQPILETALYSVGETPTLAEQIPVGFRAVTFAVDRMNALGGLVLPESHIDIALTLNSDHPSLDGVATKTILHNVRVLATSEQRFPSEERMGRNFRSVTVAVTPVEANKLILAQRHGVLSVSLRGEQGDTSEFASSGGDNFNTETIQSVLGLPPVVPEVSDSIEIWLGITREDRQVPRSRKMQFTQGEENKRVGQLQHSLTL